MREIAAACSEAGPSWSGAGLTISWSRDRRSELSADGLLTENIQIKKHMNKDSETAS